MIELFQAMLWPLLACILLPPMLVFLGVQTIRRQEVLVNLVLPEIAAIGSSAAFVLGQSGWPGYAWSLGFVWVGAALVMATRTRKTALSQTSLLTVIYVVAAALSTLLLTRSSEGAEELK